jgi:hypothetical protein
MVMYSAGITAKALIEDIEKEADIAISVPTTSYIRWLNALEQLLYSEFIKEQRVASLDVIDGIVDLSDIETSEYEDSVKADDVISVLSGINEFIKCTPMAFELFNGDVDGYYTVIDGDKIKVYDPSDSGEVKIVYKARPAPKTAENYAAAMVALPIEFIELVAAKLRGEAYKLANEDELSAKWLNDYNVQLENFKVWIAERTKAYGG